MANVSVKEIKELMTATGVGMMDCKKALVEADGDMDKAILILREKGLATQAKKAGRTAAEGIVTSVVEGNVGVVLEVNIETDFAANNEEFKAFVAAVAKTIIEKNPADVEALKATVISGGTATVEETLQELFIKIRENMVIRRFERLEGVLVPYVHGGGSIGVMVKLDTDLDADKVFEVGKNCALQIAAMNPAYLDRTAVPASVIEEEKKIMLTQMSEDPKMANKPQQVLEKIVEGKVGKFYTENCLVDQEYVKAENKESVGKYVADTAKALGGKIEVAQFVRFARGEGVEKKEDNFADEVASMIGNK
ncbi:MAG: elongation factor Ts [Oscillospiraceae bacterium]|nr:elongation factor Ts [Oscillospiraceae bacterium]